MTTHLLVVTGGHRYDQGSFTAMLDSLTGVEHRHVTHPAALSALSPGRLEDIEAILFYDMAGIEFTARGDGSYAVSITDPPADYVADIRALIAAGIGLVVLHHASASWPSWGEWAEIVGARFFYQPGELRNQQWPDSGYRLDVTHRIDVVAAGHPVVSGLGDGFEIRDELYLAPVFEADVVPLMRSRCEFVDSNFFSTAVGLAGRRDSREGWAHPPGSDLVVWAKRSERSPVVYIQPGDGPTAFENHGYRALVGNAVRWVASAEARAWLAEQAGVKPY